MAEKIVFYQIYYHESQLTEIFPFATPYFNPTLTPFFENSVIADLVLSSNAEKTGVCSWNLRKKSATFSIPPVREINEELINGDYDVLAFTKHGKTHQMLEAMEGWHKGSRETLRKICYAVGVPFKEPKYTFYQNAFIARTDIYQNYVKNALVPAMYVMDHNQEIKELCWQDSGYYKLTGKGKDDLFARQVEKYLGVIYCPMHTFLLERLFPVWLNTQKKINFQSI